MKVAEAIVMVVFRMIFFVITTVEPLTDTVRVCVSCLFPSAITRHLLLRILRHDHDRWGKQRLLLTALKGGTKHPNPEVRVFVGEIIQTRRIAESVGILRSLLRDPHPDVRCYAAVIAVEVQEIHLADSIAPLLIDPDDKVRETATWALRMLGFDWRSALNELRLSTSERT